MSHDIKYKNFIAAIKTQVEINRLKNIEKDKDKTLDKWGLILARPFGNLLAAIEDNRINDIERYVIESGAVLAEIYGYTKKPDKDRVEIEQVEDKEGGSKTKEKDILKKIKSDLIFSDFNKDPNSLIMGVHLSSGRSIQIYENKNSIGISDRYIAKVVNADGSLRMSVYGSSEKVTRNRATFKAFDYPAEADIAKSCMWKWNNKK